MTARVSGTAPRCRRPRAERLASLGILHVRKHKVKTVPPSVFHQWLVREFCRQPSRQTKKVLHEPRNLFIAELAESFRIGKKHGSNFGGKSSRWLYRTGRAGAC